MRDPGVDSMEIHRCRGPAAAAAAAAAPAALPASPAAAADCASEAMLAVLAAAGVLVGSRPTGLLAAEGTADGSLVGEAPSRASPAAAATATGRRSMLTARTG